MATRRDPNSRRLDESGSALRPGELIPRLARSFGPAIIVACVVIGPGSVLTSSQVGCRFGFQLAWVLILAGLLMFGAVVAAARVGASLPNSPLTELALGLGRPAAILAGLSVFLITSCFQFSNNLGALAAVEGVVDVAPSMRVLLLIGLNVVLTVCLWCFKDLYDVVEKAMKALLALMLLGFVANLAFARPSLASVAAGLVPRLPSELAGSFWPGYISQTGASEATSARVLIDPWLEVQGLVATTFTIAGAFYQAYLVREKGWTRSHLCQGLIDSAAGALVMITISLVIMATSATILHGLTRPESLTGVADVARQLEPLFGVWAKILFCVGIFAAAASSFLINAMIGGAMLADGLGLPARMDSVWSKSFTVAVMSIGAVVALGTASESRVPLIVFAQAVSLLGGPVLALALVYLSLRTLSDGSRVSPWPVVLCAVAAAIVVAVFALRTMARLWLVYHA
ncbi:MAG TPA: divalent metal cation transporter [Lacipirellulaceae bacterium]|nr:divalent metal cation transporter [Lacipirellulaceae bacterium]